mmetsp:Transcript_2228/g.3351  ORF Transcript_2228/g.3351 Transcript_2228/m.3351 type:complete len:457 (+) Transcript_2228:546-1916(+)
MADGIEPLGHLVARALLVAEHDDGRLLLAQDRLYARALLVFRGAPNDLLRDRLGGVPRPVPDGDEDGVPEVLLGQQLHLQWHGRGEHSGLAVHLVLVPRGLIHGAQVAGRHRLDDLHDLRLEVHVDHAVGLVQDEVVALVQHQVAPLDAVEEAAGGGDADLRSLADEEPLVLDGKPAHDGHIANLQIARKLISLAGYLLRELARGGEHDSIGSVLRQLRRKPRQLINIRQQGQQKRGCFPRACLRNAHHISVLEADGDGTPLNWRRLLVADAIEGLEERVGEPRLLPEADGVGHLRAARGDVEVLPEDAPVSRGHLVELLLGPVAVLHLLDLGLGLFLGLALLDLVLVAKVHHLHFGAALALLDEVVVEGHLLTLHTPIHAGHEATAEEKSSGHLVLVERVGVNARVVLRIPIERKLEFLGGGNDFLLRFLHSEVLVFDLLEQLIVLSLPSVKTPS